MGSTAPAGTDSPAKQEQTNVDRAFGLGWHVAELTYLQDDKQDDNPPPPQQSGFLKQVVDLDFDSRAKLLLGQISTGIGQINATGVDVPSEIEALVTLGKGKDPLTVSDLTHIPNAHETLLKNLTVADYRLGKAYAVGALIAETVLVSYKELKKPAEKTDLDKVNAVFEPKRIQLIDRQLRELKTEFEDHAVDAVSTTLRDWSDTVSLWNVKPPLSTDKDAPAELKRWLDKRSTVANELWRQGTAWRSLLSREKEAADYLHLFDYAKAIGDLLGEYAALARSIGLRGPTLGILGVMVVAVAVGAGVLALVFSQQVQAVYTALIGILAALGITGATISASVKSALTTAEDKLWETELSAAIAEAIDFVPVKIPRSNTVELRTRLRGDTPTLDPLRLEGQQLPQRPILLGRWVAISMAVGLAVIAVWTYVSIQHGAKVIDAVSVAASAGACYIVSILALIAVLNFFARILRRPYIWALPTDLPRFRTDWLVPVAVGAGVVIGKLIWL